MQAMVFEKNLNLGPGKATVAQLNFVEKLQVVREKVLVSAFLLFFYPDTAREKRWENCNTRVGRFGDDSRPGAPFAGA